MSHTVSRFALPVLLLALVGCGEPQVDRADRGLEPFPTERTAEEFPGVSYPDAGTLSAEIAGGPVWVIGVDGASWEMILPMVQRGELPNIEALMEESAHGILEAEEPTISPALWATIATGVPRFEHGVVNFLVKLPGQPESTNVGPLDRRSPAIWEYVGAAGGSAAVIHWFGSFPAEQINGHYVAKGFDPESPRPGQVHPAGFDETLRRDARVKLRRGDLDAIGKTEFLQGSLLEDARALAALRVISQQGRPDFVAVHLAGIDIVQHTTWRHMAGSAPTFEGEGPPDPNLADVIPSYYRYIDHSLGEIREMMPDDATLIVLSDHGGGPIGLQESFRLQIAVLLESLGWMDAGEGDLLAIDESFRHDKRIWLNIEGVEASGTIPLDEVDTVAGDYAERLRSLETDLGEPVFDSVVVHTGESTWRPGDPAMTVRFAPEVLLADSVAHGGKQHDLAAVRLRVDISGGHRPEGILIANGPEIRPGRFDEPATQYQIAPLALYLLGLPQDAGMLAHAPADGGVLEAVLEPSILELRPIVAVSSYPDTDRTALLRKRGDPAATTDPAFDDKLEQLRSLGYVN